MRKLEWFLENFSAGVHSYPSRQPQADVFAHRLQNVRAGPEGHLRLVSLGGELADTDQLKPVTGIAADESRWYRIHDPNFIGLVDANGNVLIDIQGLSPVVEREASFHFRYLDKRVTDEDFAVLGASVLRGRLSVIGEYEDFVIVGSEGDDHGYWMDVRDSVADDMRVLHPLGMEPPVAFAGSGGSSPQHALEDGLYVYAFTNVRAFFAEEDAVALPPQVANKEFAGREHLFNGMESNPTYMVVSVGGVRGSFFQNGEAIQRVVQLPSNNQGLHVSDVVYPYDQQTGVYVYRTVGHTTERGDAVDAPGFPNAFTANVEDLEFRVIDYLVKGRDVAGTLHSAIDLSDRPLMRIDNDVLPAGAFQLTYYNDLVFCATGDELRYSDVRFGAPVQWAFPVSNAIRAPGRIQFCTESEGILIFGGSQGLWRLTGTDEFNFQRSQFSAIGPVSRAAWGKLAKGIGFIAAGGLYLSNGVEVEKVAPAVLDAYFEGKPAVDGSVQYLADGDDVWAVRFSDGGETQFLRSSKGGWFIADGIDIRQSVRISEIDEDGDTTETVVFADGGMTVRTLNGLDVQADDDTAWFWESQELDWVSQGEGESVKTFKWLEIASGIEQDVTVRFTVDGDVFEESVALTDGFRPVRVPIRRKGLKLRVRVSGTGTVELRGLRVICEVRDSRRRF